MIWILIILFVKRLLRGFKKSKPQSLPHPKEPITFLLCFLLSALTPARSQDEHLYFKIQKGQKTLGQIDMQRIVRNDSTFYKADNQIQFKFLRKFKIEAMESSVYYEEKLQFSEVNRSINGTEKPRVLLHYFNGRYRASKGKHTVELPETDISTNLITLYFKEPFDGMEVYCDNQQGFSRVQKIEKGKYLVALPDGGSNIFQYNNGQCVRVIAAHPLFRVQLIAMNNE